MVPYAETLWAVNDVVDLSVIVYDVYKTENRVIVYDYPMLSDADAVEYVSTVFEVTDSTMDNIDFIATDGMFDVAFAWSSSNAAVINEYGVVSQPVFGEADAVVTLTVVFTKGVETIWLATDEDREGEAIACSRDKPPTAWTGTPTASTTAFN